MNTTVYDIIKANADAMRILASAGVAVEDFKYIGLFEEFCRLKRDGLKISYIVLHLCAEWEMSERTVWRILKRYNREVEMP